MLFRSEFHSVGVGLWQKVGLFRMQGASLYTHINILAKELRPGFAALFEIHVAFCFDIVLSSVIVNLHICYVCHYLSFFFLTKANKGKGRIH